jgi:hypothetical protein
MKTFEVRLSFQDRSDQPVQSTELVDASSLPGAVAKATRKFVKGLDRKQRFDMNKNGLEIKAKASGEEAEQSEAKSATAASQ